MNQHQLVTLAVAALLAAGAGTTVAPIRAQSAGHFVVR